VLKYSLITIHIASSVAVVDNTLIPIDKIDKIKICEHFDFNFTFLFDFSNTVRLLLWLNASVYFYVSGIPNTADRNLWSHCTLFASGIVITYTYYCMSNTYYYYYYYHCGVSRTKVGWRSTIGRKIRTHCVAISCVYNRRTCNRLVISV